MTHAEHAITADADAPFVGAKPPGGVISKLQLALALMLAGALSACVALPASPTAAAVGSDVAFKGTVVSVDTAPWAFDGNAVVVVDSGAQGRVAVELPARYNLCKAPGIGAASQLAAGMKVDLNGRLTAPGRLSVCESASHHIVRIP